MKLIARDRAYDGKWGSSCRTDFVMKTRGSIGSGSSTIVHFENDDVAIITAGLLHHVCKKRQVIGDTW